MTGLEPRTPAELFALAGAGRGDPLVAPLFLQLFDERHHVYAGVDSLTVARMRAELLAAVAHHSLSTQALPFVLEELESASDPRLTALAAAALRRHPEPGRRFVQPLLDALSFIDGHDDVVELGSLRRANDPERTTAATEVLRTLGWLVSSGHFPLTELQQLVERRLEPAARGDVLAGVQPPPASVTHSADDAATPTRVLRKAPDEALARVRVQDHSGVEFSFREVFTGRTTLVFFFFTRCGNPAKCPLTVATLGRLQQRIRREALPLATAAFTYDPAFDTPERLTRYARSWGAEPSAWHRFLRVPEAFPRVKDFFELGVNYGPGGVNRHQLEAFVVDRNATLVRAVTRRRWTEEELLMLAREVT